MAHQRVLQSTRSNVPHWLSDIQVHHPNQIDGIVDAVWKARLTVSTNPQAILSAWAEARQEVVRFFKIGYLTDSEAARLLQGCDEEERRATT